MLKSLKNAITFIKKYHSFCANSEEHLLLAGRIMSETIRSKKNLKSLSDVEFKVFSQWGDDGIIQWLVHNLDLPFKTFIEFGVENYRESNTRFLMMNNNWSGLVIDGSESNIDQIVKSEYFWKYGLQAKKAFVDTENINHILSSSKIDRDVGILHIDIDGNDYWIWEAIEVISPIVFICEYNSVFGFDRAITIPYDKSFNRTKAHYSNLYFGASLPAICQLSEKKGYSFIGCNSSGNNAYFIRNDKITDSINNATFKSKCVESMFRESRDVEGRLSYISGSNRIEVIKGMPVYCVNSNKIEKL